MNQEAFTRLMAHEDLSSDLAAEVMSTIARGEYTGVQIGCLLTALRMKGESASEIAAFTRVMQGCAHTIHPRVSGMMVDTCGTGGDVHTGGGTFNISTAAAIVAASAGVPVVKHGNRSVSSRCGSADVLEALGVVITQTPEQATRIIEEVGIGFLFAPLFHPAMRHVAPIRKEMGVLTVFNILGPLLNPAGAQARLIGVYDPGLVPVIADVLRQLGVTRALVVHGDGLDEITVTGSTLIAELSEGVITSRTLTPEEVGITRADKGSLQGGSPEENAAIIRTVLKGEGGACQDIVALNAGAAIYLGGRASDLASGVKIAYECIKSGQAETKLTDLIIASGERR
ncbi:MAG TPA: anthranilate phosphoribosyltransferase [Methanospirillum sp.]|nr:anthranilate phosphoribosyltransferase [Methanospirillum sp.]